MIKKLLVYFFRQTESGDSDKRAPGHAEEGGNFSKHGGWLPVRARPQAASGFVLAWGLYLP